MGDQRQGGIAWTDQTWNPLRGCSKVSEGCRNCYAMTVAARFSGPGQTYEGLARRDGGGHAHWTGALRLVLDHLEDPLRWRRPRRVFVNSMSDLFHEAVPDGWIDWIFAVMALAPLHTFQILTKRPERMQRWIREGSIGSRKHDVVIAARDHLHRSPDLVEDRFDWPLPNVWVGVSVEDQRTADERLPWLLRTPAAVRFVSYEPALGPIDWQGLFERHERDPEGSAAGYLHSASCPSFCDFGCAGVETLGGLDQIIVGGESGPDARPFDVAWARSTIAACRAAGVACFVKQLGSQPFGVGPLGGCGKVTDRKGGDPAEWPEDLRVREFPAAPR